MTIHLAAEYNFFNASGSFLAYGSLGSLHYRAGVNEVQLTSREDATVSSLLQKKKKKSSAMLMP